jgi:hypothetical protein
MRPQQILDRGLQALQAMRERKESERNVIRLFPALLRECQRKIISCRFCQASGRYGDAECPNCGPTRKVVADATGDKIWLPMRF